MSRGRRRGRQLAFQAVFMLDARDEWAMAPVRQWLARVEPPPTAEAREYALQLVTHVLEHRPQIDERLATAHPRWKLKRLRAEDRNLLRLGICELWFHEDVPPRAVLNEWIELAKVFGGEDSPRFVNGILDRVMRERDGLPLGDDDTGDAGAVGADLVQPASPVVEGGDADAGA